MHRTARSWTAPVLLLVALLLATPLLTAPPAAAATTAQRTLTGSFRWEQGDEEGRVRAIFTPAGEGHWNVEFHFKWSGAAHTYIGTADGHLDDGALTGRVESDGRRRTFTFRGECQDGKFSGTHAELVDNQEYRTGTLTMSAKS